MVIGSFLENGFEATLRPKTHVLSAWKRHFSLFCKFLSEKVETIFWEVRQDLQNNLNQNLAIGSFLENGFEATLSSKTNVVSVWKGQF